MLFLYEEEVNVNFSYLHYCAFKPIWVFSQKLSAGKEIQVLPVRR